MTKAEIKKAIKKYGITTGGAGLAVRGQDGVEFVHGLGREDYQQILREVTHA